MAAKYKSKFQDSWLGKEEYRKWLTADKDVHSARCKLCMKSFSVSNLGESALKSHASGKKHLTVAASMNSVTVTSLFSKSSTEATTSTPGTSITSSQLAKLSSTSLDSFVAKEETLRAEIIWTLNCMNHHHSFVSNSGINNIFSRMFPDSQIAKTFSLSERKTSYMTVFGIAPHVRSLLEKDLAEGPFVILFDESLNKAFKSKQMDYHVRIWDVNHVTTRFFSSKFMGHATASDMVACFEDAVGHLDMQRLLQLSMDGPNVNWSFHDKINEDLKQKHGVSLLNAGSCSLHKVHGAFKTGVEATNWHLDTTLKSMFKLFSESPARREDYVLATGSSLFPLHFCNHRWLENFKVAQRALDITSFLKVYVDSMNPKQQPSDHTVKLRNALKDVFLPAKLAFFMSLAKQVEPFLATYQTDRPMMPFMFKDITAIAIKNLSRFVKDKVMCDLKRSLDFHELDVTEDSNQLSAHKVQVGFVAESMLQKMKSDKTVSELQILEFRGACKKCLIVFAKKFLDKSPLKYGVVNHLACLDPDVIMENKKSAQLKMKKLMYLLTNNRGFLASKVDVVLEEFSDFIDSAVCSGSLSAFSRDTDRLDEFYYSLLANKKQYQNIWSVVRQLLLLSHGQASVERGFSVNKEMEECNLREQTLVARRLVVDFIRSKGGVDGVEITPKLLVSAGSAHSCYKMYLDEGKEKRQKEERGQKRKNMESEIETLKSKRQALQNDITALNISADDYAMKAEKERKISHIVHSNSLKKRVKELEGERKTVDERLDEKLDELKYSE